MKDLHSWESRLRWDVKQKEAWIEFYLKAASRRKVSLDVDYEGGLSVDPSTSQRVEGPTFDVP